MKRNYISIILVICVIAALAVFMCSCGGNKKDKSENAGNETKTEEPAEEKAETEEKTETEEPAEDETPEVPGSLEGYFIQHPDELEDIKKSVTEDESMKQSLELLDFDIYAVGNILVYDYKFKETYSDANVEAMRKKLPASLDEMEKDMADRIALIEAGYGVENVTIKIQYRNGDGSVIGERDFTK